MHREMSPINSAGNVTCPSSLGPLRRLTQRTRAVTPRSGPGHIANMKLIVGSLGIFVLLVTAVLGKSAVMFVSGLGIGFAPWSTREAPLRTQLGALVAGALVAGFGAEAIHTLYHLFGGETARGDSGFFFVSAIFVGLINAVAMGAVVILGHALGRQRAR